MHPSLPHPNNFKSSHVCIPLYLMCFYPKSGIHIQKGILSDPVLAGACHTFPFLSIASFGNSYGRLTSPQAAFFFHQGLVCFSGREAIIDNLSSSCYKSPQSHSPIVHCATAHFLSATLGGNSIPYWLALNPYPLLILFLGAQFVYGVYIHTSSVEFSKSKGQQNI